MGKASYHILLYIFLFIKKKKFWQRLKYLKILSVLNRATKKRINKDTVLKRVPIIISYSMSK